MFFFYILYTSYNLKLVINLKYLNSKATVILLYLQNVFLVFISFYQSFIERQFTRINARTYHK